MNSGRTLEEVLNFSKTIEYKESGLFTDGGWYLAFLALFLILLGVFIVVYFREVFGLVLIAFTATAFLITNFGFEVRETSHNNELRTVKKLEWEREYAQPYFRELPITSTDAFESFTYDYEAEKEYEEGTSFFHKQERLTSEKPVIVKMKNGSDVLFWAEVIYDPKLKTEYMEYKYLPKELRFEDRSSVYKEMGFQDVKIYTNKP